MCFLDSRSERLSFNAMSISADDDESNGGLVRCHKIQSGLVTSNALKIYVSVTIITFLFVSNDSLRVIDMACLA